MIRPAGIGGMLFGIIASGLDAASQDSFLRDYHPSWWRSRGAPT